ncbi:N-formylglutamate amidohydrolase [Sphingomonas sp.]|uniref:N-formylglutamate amidohydrolase n=1 Tax=Sphingomonas sp. TaxID=28214 RepID=UPI003B3BBD81
MTAAWTELPGDPARGLLLIADHASNRVPADIALGVVPEVLDQHVAIDIGVAPLAASLCAALDCPGVLGGVSRLVVDLNREEDAAGLIPLVSDGIAVPGNEALTPEARAQRLGMWRAYHDHIADLIAACRPKLLISLHSFTPMLTVDGAPRPWQVGILYNQDERAARIALPLLAAAGVAAGDNLPYSGKVLNATMNSHGEANGIAYLGIEVRQDLIGDPDGVGRWSALLAPVIAQVAEAVTA